MQLRFIKDDDTFRECTYGDVDDMGIIIAVSFAVFEENPPLTRGFPS